MVTSLRNDSCEMFQVGIEYVCAVGDRGFVFDKKKQALVYKANDLLWGC